MIDLKEIKCDKLYIVGNTAEIEAYKTNGRIQGRNIVMQESLQKAFSIYKLYAETEIKDMCNEIAKCVYKSVKNKLNTKVADFNNLIIYNEIVKNVDEIFVTNIEKLSYICIDTSKLKESRCEAFRYVDNTCIVTDKMEKEYIDYISEPCDKVRIRDRALELTYLIFKEIIEKENN